MKTRLQATRRKQIKPPGQSFSNRYIRLSICLTALSASLNHAPAYADETPESTEQSTTQQSGYVEVGGGYQSEDSAWFGRYTGLTDKGPFFVGDFVTSSKDDTGKYTLLAGRRLGLDSRSLLLDHGVQGRYALDLTYDQLPNNIYSTTVTPYQDSGNNSLNLPGSVLDEQNYRQIDIGTERKRLGGDLSITPTQYWTTKLGFLQDKKRGSRQSGGALGFQARNQAMSILPEPVDYTTDQVDASLGYAKGKGHFQLDYHLSMFRNANESLEWQNPFPSPDGKAGSFGQLALEPDNDFQQLSLSGGYRLPANTYLTGLLSSGLMTQDQAYVPYTENSAIPVEPLPEESLDGSVRQNIAYLKLASRPAQNWSFNGSYRYHDHDNRTSQAAYTSPRTDSLPPGKSGEVYSTTVNQPYSYTRQLGKLDGKYRLGRSTSLMLGYDAERMQRENAEVDQTDEHEIWSKFKWKLRQAQVTELVGSAVDGWLKYGHTSRDGSGYHLPTVDATGAYTENPLMRKYNLADLERDEVRLYLSFSPTERLNLSANAAYSNSDYTDSIIGLTEASNRSATLEATYVPTTKITTYAYYTRDMIASEQAGRESSASASGSLEQRYEADWFANTDDTMDNFGIGLEWHALLPKLDVGADYIYSRGVGETDLLLAGSTPFPNLETRLYSLKLYAQYNHSPDLSFNLRYWNDRFDSQDWGLDGVTPISSDYPTSLFMAGGSPDYDVDVITLSMRYFF